MLFTVLLFISGVLTGVKVVKTAIVPAKVRTHNINVPAVSILFVKSKKNTDILSILLNYYIQDKNIRPFVKTFLDVYDTICIH